MAKLYKWVIMKKTNENINTNSIFSKLGNSYKIPNTKGNRDLRIFNIEICALSMHPFFSGKILLF